MSERGQIIIPKEVREEVHASTNTTFVVEAIDKDTNNRICDGHIKNR